MMQNQRSTESSNKKHQKRISYFMIGIFFMGAILMIRLFQKSVLEHEKYMVMAQNQYVIKKEIPARRGRIYAQDISTGENYPLATNVEKYAISVVPKNVKDKLLMAEKLADLLEMDYNEIFEKINNDKLYISPLKHGVDEELAQKIANLQIIGTLIVQEDIRYYPEKHLGSQVLGFVNKENEGKYGIEGYYNEELKGNSGIIEAEKDTYGRFISVDTSKAVKNGNDLVLSIEHNVQFTAEQKLRAAIEKYGAEDGSIIIMNPKTGAIIAMAGAKDYNPNNYNELSKEEQNLFLNPTIGYVWEPGSIMKPIIMAAAINEGKIEPDTEEVFSNMTVVQGYEIHTAQDKSFGRETMTQCLENSDNVCMVWVADKLGNDTMYKYLESFGFGSKTGIDSDGEAVGSLLNLHKWRDIYRATISFGQGISVTPLQMINAISVIANNGIMNQPYFVEKIVKYDGEEIQTQPKQIGEIISNETAAKLRGMMVSVVEKGHGKRAGVSGYKVGGKTGTAQVPNPEGGYYEDKFIGSFSGFFPAENPQFAMLVKLDSPSNVEWAESSAAPLFGEMAQWLLNYYGIPPTENK